MNRMVHGGGGGIRTHVACKAHAFQACAIDRYATPPVFASRTMNTVHKVVRL